MHVYMHAWSYTVSWLAQCEQIVVILPNLQTWCSWGRDKGLDFEIKRSKVKVTTRPSMASISLLSWCLVNHLWELHQTYIFSAVWDKDELVTFWGQNAYRSSVCWWIPSSLFLIFSLLLLILIIPFIVIFLNSFCMNNLLLDYHIVLQNFLLH